MKYKLWKAMRISNEWKALTLSAAMVSAIACAPSATAVDPLQGPDQGCAKGSAQIGIGDGFERILCGCAEPAGAFVGSGAAPLTCTVTVGTEVFFHYLGTRLRHQVISSGGLGFPSGPLCDPAVPAMMRTHAFSASAAGTYNFADAFDSGLSGRIIAQ